ncbi:MAG: FimV family protein [Gammaproteobacteria bacterium]
MQPTLLPEANIMSQDIDLNKNKETKTGLKRGLHGSLKTLSYACAFGSLFVFAQTYALSLQNIQINSALGEPLDAVVMVNAGPNERLQASCITTRPSTDSGMPNIRGIQLSLSRSMSPGTIRLTTGRPVNEPMSEIVVHIECPGAPAVKRSFLIMLDPQGVADASSARNNAAIAQNGSQENVTSSAPGTRPISAAVVTSSDNRVNVRSRQVTVTPGNPIAPGTNHRVASGESLSTIAARVEGRDYGTVWSWAATIHAANPHAFINGNPNELIAGSQLYVPQTMASGTLGLSLPAATKASSATPKIASADAAAAAAEAMSRFSSRLSDINAVTDFEPAIIAPTQKAAVGSVKAIQPVMVMATSFSGVSRERLRQRNRGLIQAAPENLPNFVAGADTQPAPQAANDSAKAPVNPEPRENQTPTQPVAAKPEAANNTGGRFSYLTALAGLGLLLAAFFAGWWLSKRRAEDAIEERLEARMNEESYRERVRTGRQEVIRQRMGGASTIQVTESAGQRNDTLTSEFTENDLDEVIGAALEEDSYETGGTINLNVNAAEPITDNEGPMINADELEIEFDATHEIGEIDLELLERDYAAQTETNSGLEEIADAGRGKENNDAPDNAIGMEFPEEVKLRKQSGPAPDTVEFDVRSEPIDFDIGLRVDDADPDKTEALGLDLEEAGANIDAHLEQLRQQDSAHEGVELDATSEVEMTLDLSDYKDDMAIEDLLDDDQTSSVPTQGSEEFYHLEASSIMNVGELDFEKGPDDETNILRFRQRNIRTGTDDSSSDEE